MSRGCVEFTVQQLMDELFRKSQELQDSLPDVHQKLGYAVMNNVDPDSWAAQQHKGTIRERAKKINDLRELASEIERECGWLFDRTHKEKEE